MHANEQSRKLSNVPRCALPKADPCSSRRHFRARHTGAMGGGGGRRDAEAARTLAGIKGTCRLPAFSRLGLRACKHRRPSVRMAYAFCQRLAPRHRLPMSLSIDPLECLGADQGDAMPSMRVSPRRNRMACRLRACASACCATRRRTKRPNSSTNSSNGAIRAWRRFRSTETRQLPAALARALPMPSEGLVPPGCGEPFTQANRADRKGCAMP